MTDRVDDWRKGSLQVPAVIEQLAEEAYWNAWNHGFWACGMSHETAVVKLALIHSEVSEALEVLRTRTDASTQHGFLEELADVVIRTLDLAGAIDSEVFAKVLLQKMSENVDRPAKHGKAF